MPKQPQDHKKPAEQAGVFTFDHDGKTYALRDVYSVLTPGFLRKNRKLDAMDQFFTMVEALADDDALEAVDTMSRDEFVKFQRDFEAFLEATPGE